MQVAVGNGRYYGGGMTIVEDAAIDDGRLDLYALPAAARAGGWRCCCRCCAGAGTGRSKTSCRCTARRSPSTPTGPLPINVDGEVRGRTPAVFRVVPRALRVFCSVRRRCSDCALIRR